VVTGNYFSVLGAQAALGGCFARPTIGWRAAGCGRAQLRLLAAPVRRRPAVIGRAVQLENVSFMIVV